MFLFSFEARELQVGIGVSRIELQQSLEPGTGTFRLSADEKMIAIVIEKCRRRRPLRQRFAIVCFRFIALLFGVKAGGFPQ